MDYKIINEHMKNKFGSSDKIIELDNLTEGKINSITDTQMFKAHFSVLAIDLVGSKKLNQTLDVEIYNKLISEFVYGVSSIMKSYGGLWITIQGDMVYCIFNTKTKSEIDTSFDAACHLNVFIKHLNKNFHKFFNNTNIKAGIGLWFSYKNYITKVGKSGQRDIVFMGEAVNGACTLANTASRNNYSNILFNGLIKANFTDKTNEEHNKIGSFNNYSLRDFPNQKIYGCDWIIIGYNNFVKNNV